MDGKRKKTALRVSAVVGGVLVVLLVLMAIGLAVHRDRDGGKQTQEFVDLKQETGVQEPEAPKEGLNDSREATGTNAPSAGKASQGAGSQTRTQGDQVPSLEVKVIKTGTMTIEFKKGTFNDIYGKVALAAEAVGGYVSDTQSSTDDGRISGGTIKIRVPNKDYARVMERLKELGDVTALSEQTQDVTEEFVDLESRLRNLRAQEAVYLDLMAKAKTIEESIAVQKELTVIQEQVEQLSGRKNYLEDHVQFSSIQVTLVEPGATGGSGGEGWGFVQALKDAAHGVVDGLNEVIKFAGDALVYIVIIVALGLAAYFLLKSRGRKKVSGDTTADA
jgi:rRNA maturation endonuclease Nob1